MINRSKQNDDRPAFSSVRPRAVRVAHADLVHVRPPHDRGLPVLLEPARPGVDLAGWMNASRAEVEALLDRHGALLFRGFGIASAPTFQQLAATVSGPLLEYTYGSTPRQRVGGGVYTSTEYPASQVILQHNEMSYTTRWPMKIWFCCLQAATTGGETPLADSRRVLARIPDAVRARFDRDGVRYVRHYGGGPDVSWPAAFQTHDKQEVEAFCREAGIEWSWIGADRLRTSQICQATARHPRTRDDVWFNQAHLFHFSSLPLEVREAMERRGERSTPSRHVTYGDGAEIEPEALDAIRAAYDAETVAFPWQHGDILLVDNMLVSHGRLAFEGARRVVVAMTEPNRA